MHPFTPPPELTTALELDAYWMQLALQQAQAALAAGEVPVGAVVVCADQCVATGHNAPRSSCDPTAHAEIVALRAAAAQRGNYRLDDCVLYVTLEPCSMCAGAILQARLQRVVYAVSDPKTGAAGSVCNLFELRQLNHQTTLSSGALAADSAALLQAFFLQRRRAQRHSRLGRALRDNALRTPEACFSALPPAPLPSFFIHDLPSLNGLRLHYLDSGGAEAQSSGSLTRAWLLLHGTADWSQVWHAAIAQQHWPGRVVCPDLIGFGKSDKPKKVSAHRLAWHADILFELASRLQLVRPQVLAPRSQQCLVEQLLGRPQTADWSLRWVDLPALAGDALRAPFPDAGHQAALRAFSGLTIGARPLSADCPSKSPPL